MCTTVTHSISSQISTPTSSLFTPHPGPISMLVLVRSAVLDFRPRNTTNQAARKTCRFNRQAWGTRYPAWQCLSFTSFRSSHCSDPCRLDKDDSWRFVPRSWRRGLYNWVYPTEILHLVHGDICLLLYFWFNFIGYWDLRSVILELVYVYLLIDYTIFYFLVENRAGRSGLQHEPVSTISPSFPGEQTYYESFSKGKEKANRRNKTSKSNSSRRVQELQQDRSSAFQDHRGYIQHSTASKDACYQVEISSWSSSIAKSEGSSSQL